MAIEDNLKARIESLIKEGRILSLSDDNGYVDDELLQRCSGWVTAAHNAVHNACPDPNTPYRQKAAMLALADTGYFIHRAVGQLAAVLKNLLIDAEAGLLASVADRAKAEAFDDFLDHAEAYAKENRKSESGVIAGVVFEDTLRRICKKLNIQERDVKLDSLISELVSCGELTSVKAKRARAAAGARTKATHAQWDEFEISDVQATINFTRELIANKLDA